MKIERSFLAYFVDVFERGRSERASFIFSRITADGADFIAKSAQSRIRFRSIRVSDEQIEIHLATQRDVGHGLRPKSDPLEKRKSYLALAKLLIDGDGLI